MRDLDETDHELLRLLSEDARRPYSDLAEKVDLSAPAVSDRIDRLKEVGVIEGFTVDLDRSKLREGVRMAVTFETTPGETTTVREALADCSGVEQVFVTAEGRLFVVATVPDGDVETHLAAAFETGAVESVEATPLVATDRQAGLGEATLGLDCAECGNTVTDEGVTARIGGERYEFCCESCEARFTERYDELKEGA
ncbi:AsnC family transcriptional regulator [Natronomonas halophila]|uniref:AsnC family transcriptional regulator n=1 Tax=Natronomonas halophila TaxID=2747817 RepID=UPI0015B382C2|nr:AsnC family transcriptional regulator [Natronomonas halophila]QLD84314.1 AsnC family transcriptional regulator [Natronomonas halophila]